MTNKKQTTNEIELMKTKQKGEDEMKPESINANHVEMNETENDEKKTGGETMMGQTNNQMKIRVILDYECNEAHFSIIDTIEALGISHSEFPSMSPKMRDVFMEEVIFYDLVFEADWNEADFSKFIERIDDSFKAGLEYLERELTVEFVFV